MENVAKLQTEISNVLATLDGLELLVIKEKPSLVCQILARTMQLA